MRIKSFIARCACILCSYNLIAGDHALTVNASSTIKANTLISRVETWDAYYYINGDPTVEYPYLNCRAYIYNNGTIDVFYNNIKDWGSSQPNTFSLAYIDAAEIGGDAYNACMRIVNNRTLLLGTATPTEFDRRNRGMSFGPRSDVQYNTRKPKDIRLSVYPNTYTYSGGKRHGREPNVIYPQFGVSDPAAGFDSETLCLVYYDATTGLAEWGSAYLTYTWNEFSSSYPYMASFTPKNVQKYGTKLGSTESIRYLGHTMTIDPSNLRGIPDVDINKDGSVNSLDASTILKWVLEWQLCDGYYSFSNDRERNEFNAVKNADVNSDGSITAIDAQFVLQYYLESEVLGNDIPDIVSWANAQEE